ncbi:MAG: phage holin family protein [Nibricoccus sp.]
MDNATTTSPLPNIGLGQIVPALKVFLGGAVHRGELVALELSQLSHHALLTVVAALVAAALFLLGGFAATFMIAAMVWDMPERTLILGLVALGYLLVGGSMIWLAAYRIRAWRPFLETRRQLRSDSDCLQNLLTPQPKQTPNGNGDA